MPRPAGRGRPPSPVHPFPDGGKRREKIYCKNNHPVVGRNLYEYTDRFGKYQSQCRACSANYKRILYRRLHELEGNGKPEGSNSKVSRSPIQAHCKNGQHPMICLAKKVWFCPAPECRVLVVYIGGTWKNHYFDEEEALPYFQGHITSEGLVRKEKKENAS